MKRGFTLVEMLVVIAIITLMIALLLPIMSSLRAEAHRVVCLSNMQQIYTGFRGYANDYRGRVAVIGRLPTIGSPDWVGYFINMMEMPKSGLVYPYLENEEIYLCPADSKHRDPSQNVCSIPPYATHSYSVPYRREADQFVQLDQSQAMMVDESEVTVNDGIFINRWDTFASRHRMSSSKSGQKGRAGGNILFCDGHVEFFLASDIIGADHNMFR